MKKVIKIKPKIVIFFSREKSLYIAWACFRNVLAPYESPISLHYLPFLDPINPQCSDWEVFDGTDCVCADDVSAKCTDQGGMVCDNLGSQYKSACAYALDTCTEKISMGRNIETCGKQMILHINRYRTTSHIAFYMFT